MVATTSFATLANRYRAFFFDAYGVLKNSQGPLEGAADLLAWLTGQGKEVYILTNDASRSPTQMSQGYLHPELGPVVPPSRIISSGLLAKDYLRAKVRSGVVAYLGKPGAAFYIESAGLTALPIGRYKGGDRISAVALMDDEGFDWCQDLNVALNLVRKLSVPIVVANSDLSYPVDTERVGLGVGSLGRMLERIVGKSFVFFGKPDTMMFAYAHSCAFANDPQLKKEEILMVGDTLGTDIVGANTFGLDTALVLTGNTSPSEAQMRIEASGIIPTHVCESVLS